MVGSINNNGAYNLLPSSFFDPKTNALLVDEATAQQVQAGIQAKLDKLPPIGDAAFLQMVADLVPGDVDTPQKLQATLDSFEAAAAQLGNADSEVIGFVGDIAKMLARLMIEQTASQRQNALNDRLAAREQAKSELLNQAAEMDKAAAKMIEGATTAMATALAGAIVQIMGSAVSLIGSLKSLSGMSSAMKETKALTEGIDKTVSDSTKALMQAQEQIFGRSQALSQVFGAIGQMASGVGEATRASGASQDAKMQAEAKKLEAQGSRDAAEAQESQQTADNKKQMEEALNDMIKQIINFLKELREAEVDAMRALTKV